MAAPINRLWKQQAPRTDNREESRSRARALTRLAYEVAYRVRTGVIEQSPESLRLSINQLMRDDEGLRLLGFSDCDRSNVLNAARSLLTTQRGRW